MPGRPRISFIQDGLYSRSEIRALCDVSFPTVTRWEKEGKLGEKRYHPSQPGRIFYGKDSVDAWITNWRPRFGKFQEQKEDIRESSAGKLTANVFRLMKEGKSFQDIVIEVEATAAVVRRIMSEYDKDHTYLTKAEQEREERKERQIADAEIRRNKRQDKYWEKRTEFEVNRIKTEAKQKARSTESNAPRSRVQLPEFLTKKS